MQIGINPRSVINFGQLFIKSITLYRLSACLSNKPDELISGEFLRSVRSGGMGDFFFDNRAVYIIYAKAQGHLGKGFPQHDPEGFNVGEIVQH
jgi:hypothetical protein